MDAVFINPNSTEAMTATILAQARRAAPGLRVAARTSHVGPPAIQGREDGALAEAALLPLVARAEADGAGCIVIACADDTGLAAARARAGCPVIGIGQAAYHLAALAADRFSVVTTLDVSVPILAENVARAGLSGQLGMVHASGVPVLAIERDPDAAFSAIAAAVETAVRRDGAGAIVLGCAGMAPLTARLQACTRARIVDGVTAAAQVAMALISLKIPDSAQPARALD